MTPTPFVVSAVLLAALCAGCSDAGSAVTGDMHEDFNHDHRHQHTDGDDHEHAHKSGFRGAHSHPHTHGHRHGDPLHGGRIVSIGHTHHKAGVNHFHAEVMPLTDNTIRFHLLTETSDGDPRDYPIKDREIVALISVKGQESTGTEQSCQAVGDSGQASEFTLAIPEDLTDGNAFSVVIPKVVLDGQRQHFSFTVTREQAETKPNE